MDGSFELIEDILERVIAEQDKALAAELKSGLRKPRPDGQEQQSAATEQQEAAKAADRPSESEPVAEIRSGPTRAARAEPRFAPEAVTDSPQAGAA